MRAISGIILLAILIALINLVEAIGKHSKEISFVVLSVSGSVVILVFGFLFLVAFVGWIRRGGATRLIRGLFRAAAWLIDPFWRLLRDGRRGFFSDIHPSPTPSKRGK